MQPLKFTSKTTWGTIDNCKTAQQRNLLQLRCAGRNNGLASEFLGKLLQQSDFKYKHKMNNFDIEVSF